MKDLRENCQTQKKDLRSISELWEEGKQHIKAFTKRYTTADTTPQIQKSVAKPYLK